MFKFQFSRMLSPSLAPRQAEGPVTWPEPERPLWRCIWAWLHQEPMPSGPPEVLDELLQPGDAAEVGRVDAACRLGMAHMADGAWEKVKGRSLQQLLESSATVPRAPEGAGAFALKGLGRCVDSKHLEAGSTVWLIAFGRPSYWRST